MGLQHVSFVLAVVQKVHPSAISISFAEQKQPILWLTVRQKHFDGVDLNNGRPLEFWQKANGPWHVVLKEIMQKC